MYHNMFIHLLSEPSREKSRQPKLNISEYV